MLPIAIEFRESSTADLLRAAAHGDVLDGADFGIGPGPAFARGIIENDPQQIELRAIINDGIGEAGAFGRIQREWGGELREHEKSLSKNSTRDYIADAVPKKNVAN
jgi:hypothetical protein